MLISKSEPIFKRVLLKLSGEAIKTDKEVISFDFLEVICATRNNSNVYAIKTTRIRFSIFIMF